MTHGDSVYGGEVGIVGTRGHSGFADVRVVDGAFVI